MVKEYSQSFARSIGSHYFTVANIRSSAKVRRMDLNEAFRKHLDREIRDSELSVNALATSLTMSEGSIRAILNGTTKSTRLETVEKLAEGLGVSPGRLLGLERQPINSQLLDAILTRLLQNIVHQETYAQSLSRSALRAYEAGLLRGVDPQDSRDIGLLTDLESDRLRTEARQLKASK